MGIDIFDEHNAIFKNVFTNQHIYAFLGNFRLDSHINVDIYPMDETIRDYARRIKTRHIDDAVICRRQLYDIVQLNIKPNEIVELYSALVDNRNSFEFGPPEEERRIDAEQIMRSNLLDVQENVKIEIYRTK